MKVLQKIASVIVAILTLFAPTNAVMALTEAEADLYSLNGVNIYDPNADQCYSGGGGGNVSLSGNTVPAKIVNYLTGNNPTGFNLSGNGIAGILANFQGESGFNPFRFQGDSVSGPAYGIAQFDPMSKITSQLSSDSRTSSYFNSYFDVKYSSTNFETGFPNESVPEEVLDAWLAVQLDYFFGPSSEFENTTVGQFRNVGGDMGLGYISSGMTAHQAMDAAQTPEDAARIFVWIMERPADKSGASERRGSMAREWFDKISSGVDTSSSSDDDTKESGGSSDGSGVTIIGDSITVGSNDQILAKLPGADIHAQVSKQFYSGSSENPGGFDILKQLADSGALRATVIYALGTNSSVTSDQVQDVVNTVGSSKKVMFVTNYTKTRDYTANNNAYNKAKNDNPNVLVADWKGAVEAEADKYLGGDGIHPTDAGKELFASIISNGNFTVNNEIETCGGSGLGSLDGGLDEGQVGGIAGYYNSSASDAYAVGLPSGKNNCVSFSIFFVRRFTTLGASLSISGNGVDLASNLAAAYGLPSGTEPRPYAVFSTSEHNMICSDIGRWCGHTGVVLSVNGDEIITVEASYGDSRGAFVMHRNKSYFVNEYQGSTFTYLESVLDQAALAEVLGG